MASVMPTDTYPKVYASTTHTEVKNATEDTSYQATARYATGQALSYPKTLKHGPTLITVHNAQEESDARAKFAQG